MAKASVITSFDIVEEVKYAFNCVRDTQEHMTTQEQSNMENILKCKLQCHKNK